MKKLILATCLTALLSTAHAAFNNGNKLLSDLNSSDAGNRVYALGYILGVVDSYDEELFCIPGSVNAGQLRDIVQQHLATNPKDRHLHAGALVAIALIKEFPCKKGGV
jgi:Rap1a immunity proteins